MRLTNPSSVQNSARIGCSGRKLKCRPLYDASAHSAFPVENPLLERNPKTTSNPAPHCCFAASTCAPLNIHDPVFENFSRASSEATRLWCPRNRGSKKPQCTTDSEFARHAHHAFRRSRVVRAAAESLPGRRSSMAGASVHLPSFPLCAAECGSAMRRKKKIDRRRKNPHFQ